MGDDLMSSVAAGRMIESSKRCCRAALRRVTFPSLSRTSCHPTEACHCVELVEDVFI